MPRFKFITLGLLLWSLAFSAWASGVVVRADRDTVQVGDDFILEFSTSEPVTATPDFTPLSTDFKVTSTSTSTNVQYINGKMSQQTIWIVTLFANRAGQLQVPSIQFGSLSSDPVTVEVIDPVAEDPQATNGPADILVELSAEPPNPYVQQQVIVTQRLLHSVPLLPTRASMSHPELEKGKGLIQQLGSTKNGDTVRKGVRYKVIERRYAVFPQVSGELSLGRTVFQGALDDRRSRQLDPFGIGGKQVRRFSEPLTLNVQTHPAVQSTWLPANSLTLNAHWEPSNRSLKAGEPVTLTVAIIADGLMGEQLPALDIKPPTGIKGYANQPEFRNDLGGNSVIGIREEKWVLIGTADGDYVLPEIKVDWWDLKAKKIQTARIDATALKVVGLGQTNPSAANPAANAPSTAANNTEPTPSVNQTEPANPSLLDNTAEPPKTKAWLWFVLVAAGVMLVALIAWLLKRKARASSSPKKTLKPTKIAPLQALKVACQHNDAQAAFQALQEWIREDLQLSPATIASLRAKADLPLKQALDDLSTVLYASTTHVWDGNDLWQAVQKYQASAATVPVAPSQGLAELYPN